LGLTSSSSHGSNTPTETVQTEKASQSEATDDLTAYLGVLLERQIIDDTELLHFIEGLEHGEISNPIPEEKTWNDSAAYIHREEIQKYIKTTQLNQNRLLEWSLQSLKEKERVRVKREETHEETKDTHWEMELHPVREGSFLMGDEEKVNVI